MCAHRPRIKGGSAVTIGFCGLSESVTANDAKEIAGRRLPQQLGARLENISDQISHPVKSNAKKQTRQHSEGEAVAPRGAYKPSKRREDLKTHRLESERASVARRYKNLNQKLSSAATPLGVHERHAFKSVDWEKIRAHHDGRQCEQGPKQEDAHVNYCSPYKPTSTPPNACPRDVLKQRSICGLAHDFFFEVCKAEVNDGHLPTDPRQSGGTELPLNSLLHRPPAPK